MENITDNQSSLTSVLGDNSGGTSSIRVLMLVWGIGVFLIWAFGAIMAYTHGNYTLPTIPAEVITTLLGVSGIKCVQRFGEKS